MHTKSQISTVKKELRISVEMSLNQILLNKKKLTSPFSCDRNGKRKAMITN